MVWNRQQEAKRFLRKLLPSGVTLSSDLDGNELTRAVEGYQQGLIDETVQLKRRVVLLERAIAAMPVGVFITDITGDEILRSAEFFDSSTPHGALTKHTVDVLISRAGMGEPVSEIIEVQTPPRRTFQVTAEGLVGDIEVTTTDDEVQETSTSYRQRIGTVAFVNDITEARRIDAIRRDFISNISHELRTPVGAIAILAETLTGETDPATAQRLTMRLEKEAHRMADMVSDLLSLSSVEAEGGFIYESTPVDSILPSVIERTEANAELRKVTVNCDSFGSDLNVVGERRQLISALTNLVDNAIKYSGEGSTVTISAASEDNDGRAMIAFRVQDQGMGIPARERERIFERFYRVDKARARDTGGTGLGLAIVRHVAVNHNGDVRVESFEGMGSTFVLTIPAS
jgi:two-component system, OmpR family, sensor histidine kinase SenX3